MILETQRLVLRTICKEDISSLQTSVFSYYKVMQYAFGGKVFSRDETKNFIANNFAKENDKIGLAVLIHKDTKRLIGFAGLLKYEHFTPNSYEIGKTQIDYALNTLNAKMSMLL